MSELASDQPVERSRPIELGAAVLSVAAGGGLAFFGASRPWDTVTVTRAAPLAALQVDLAGRTVQPGVAGLGVVALAGVVALVATRGSARRAVGAVLALAGLGLAVLAGRGLAPVPDARARTLVTETHTGAVIEVGAGVDVSTVAGWIILAVVGGVLVGFGGVLTAVRGGRWGAMGARYESPSGSRSRPSVPPPADAETARARADLALWQSIDRGDDPTADGPGAQG